MRIDKPEPRWPASLAVLAAIALYVTLPARFTIGPLWLIPVLESAMLLPLSVLSPHRRAGETRWEQVLAIILIAVVNIANVVSLVALVRILLTHGRNLPARN